MDALDEAVERQPQRAELVMTVNGQAFGQVAFAVGDVFHGAGHGQQRLHQHANQHAKQADDDQHGDDQSDQGTPQRTSTTPSWKCIFDGLPPGHGTRFERLGQVPQGIVCHAGIVVDARKGAARKALGGFCIGRASVVVSNTRSGHGPRPRIKAKKLARCSVRVWRVCRCV